MTQTVEEQVSNLVNASNQLTATVENKVQEIDSKVDTAINEVRSNLTILSTNTLRKQVEAVSGGRNTVIIDAQGNENVMCVVPRFNVEDLGLTSLNLGVGTHPAFITDGAPRSEILVAKYLASSGLAGGCSVVGGAQPMVNVDYDQSKLLCTQKGVGWHMMSIHEWAALGLWAKQTAPSHAETLIMAAAMKTSLKLLFALITELLVTRQARAVRQQALALQAGGMTVPNLACKI